MSQYKLDKREQRLRRLKQAFPERQNKSNRKMYLIDSSFKRSQTKKCTKVQRTLFYETVNELIDKERSFMKIQQLDQQKQELFMRELKLTSYGKKKQQHNILKLQTSPSYKKKVLMNQNQLKKIYIERKYNSKLAYQMHNIIQAKNIQKDRQILKEKLNQKQQSPLIKNILTRTQRKTDGANLNIKKNNYTGNLTETSKIQLPIDLNQSKIILKNQKIRQVLDIKQRNYISPISKGCKKLLKKCSSTMHFTGNNQYKLK